MDSLKGVIILKYPLDLNNSPIVYGLALDGEVGVAVDNFPMRGSSGFGFH